MVDGNVISIKKHDINLPSFADLMSKTEANLNEKARICPKDFTSISASKLELLAVETMKEVSHSTPFKEEEIKLVSGLSFPDIIAETFYGVEVKSTQNDHWTSVGSSILETTRDKNVESIYMLFGKLGGQPQFKCRPYEECLYDITVTHSPRYLIDMKTSKQGSIFSKMNTTYDTLRQSNNSIAQVRKYYREKAKKNRKGEMAWWITDIGEEQPKNALATSDNMMIRHITSLTKQEKKDLIMQLYILFPRQMIYSKYIEPSMWLVAYHKLVCHNMRDFISAGGQVKLINGNKLVRPIPAIVKRFLDYAEMVKSNIDNMCAELDVFNPDLLKKPH